MRGCRSRRSRPCTGRSRASCVRRRTRSRSSSAKLRASSACSPRASPRRRRRIAPRMRRTPRRRRSRPPSSRSRASSRISAAIPAIDPTKHPSVQQAQAALDRAKLDLSYTTITAPNDGIVTQVEKLQVGRLRERGHAGVRARLHAQPVDRGELQGSASSRTCAPARRPPSTIDTYGDKTFKAHVASISPGTGAQFSVLPPQNATGNWVKVVQRLPVRLEIEDADPEHPLYIGSERHGDRRHARAAGRAARG